MTSFSAGNADDAAPAATGCEPSARIVNDARAACTPRRGRGEPT